VDKFYARLAFLVKKNSDRQGKPVAASRPSGLSGKCW